MHIGIAGPISVPPLLPFLNEPASDVPSGLGGVPVVLLVRGLLEQGYRVTVYTLDKAVTRALRLDGDRLTVHVGPVRERHRMRDGMRAERRAVHAMIEADPPDVVHAHWTYEYALGALGSGVPTVTTVHDWGPAILRYSPDLYRVGRLAMQAVALLRGTHLIANSPYIQHKIRRYLRRTAPVIPNAVPDATFASTRPQPPSSRPVVVSINNGFAGRKNVPALLEAFPHVRRRLPGCRLRLIGSGAEPEGEASRWARAHELGEGVDFVGPVSHAEVLAELERAALLIHPAQEESFGMTLLEAMAKRTPVVAGQSSGAVPWVLGEGRAGVLTDVTDPQTLAASALTVLTNPMTWHRLSKAGWDRAWTLFRLSQVVDRHLAEYDSVLSSTPAMVS